MYLSTKGTLVVILKGCPIHVAVPDATDHLTYDISTIIESSICRKGRSGNTTPHAFIPLSIPSQQISRQELERVAPPPCDDRGPGPLTHLWLKLHSCSSRSESATADY